MSRRTLVREAAFFGIPMLVAALVTAVIAPPLLDRSALQRASEHDWLLLTAFAEGEPLLGTLDVTGPWRLSDEPPSDEPPVVGMSMNPTGMRGPMPMIVRVTSTEPFIEPMAIRFDCDSVTGLDFGKSDAAPTQLDLALLSRVAESVRVTAAYADGSKQIYSFRVAHPILPFGRALPFFTAYLPWWWGTMFSRLGATPTDGW